MTSIRRLGLAAPAGLVLALAGCGGEEQLSKAEYEQAVRAVYADVQQAFRATGVSSRLAARVAQAQAQLREGADRLEAIEPPQEVEEENEELVAGMRAYARDLERARAAAARGDSTAIATFSAGLRDNEAVERMAEAAEEMTFKGYDLGAIAKE